MLMLMLILMLMNDMEERRGLILNFKAEVTVIGAS